MSHPPRRTPLAASEVHGGRRVVHQRFHTENAPHVDVDGAAELPASTGGGVCVHWTDQPQVIYDGGLVESARTDVIVHELIHAVRGPVGRGSRWRHLRVREERTVNAMAAAWLVPVTDLADFCDRMADLGQGVGPDEVMTEYDVSRRVAEYALDNLTEHERGTA